MIEERIRLLCDRQGLSLKMACEASGVTYGTLHAQLSRGREVPFSTMDKLAAFFDVPLGFFSERRPSLKVLAAPQELPSRQSVATAYTGALQSTQLDLMRKGYGLGTEQILDWLSAEGGVLRNFDAIRDRVDLFHPVEATDIIMRPKRIGQASLAAIHLGLENEQHYVDVVGKFDRTLIDRVLSAHIQAARMPYMVSDEAIEVEFGGHRVLAQVHDAQGKAFMLVHAQPIRTPAERTAPG